LIRIIVSLWLLTLAFGCAIFPEPAGRYGAGYREKGIASWYGEDFHGRRTASGEVYDMYGLTAAHRVMPLGTYLKVTNLDNGKSVIVKANDRGPFVRGRILDLSYGAARVLEMTRTGTARVEIEVMEPGRGRPGPFTVQVGAFVMEENAKGLSLRLSPRYQNVSIIPFETNGITYFRVRVGSFPEEHQAQRLSQKLSRKEGLESFVTRQDP
jgi:rare lipoprotein A